MTPVRHDGGRCVVVRPGLPRLSIGLGFIALAGCGGSGWAEADRSRAAPSDPPPYRIEGEAVRPGERGIEGAVHIVETARGDVDGDGRLDLAVVLLRDSPGSGVFYYLNVFRAEDSGDWRLLGEDFLGDRLRLQWLEIYRVGSVSRLSGAVIPTGDAGLIVVAYRTHAAGQAMAETPALLLTPQWRVVDDRLARTRAP